jgi:hypothetical protein
MIIRLMMILNMMIIMIIIIMITMTIMTLIIITTMMTIFAYVQATYELPIEPEVEVVEEVKEGKKEIVINSQQLLLPILIPLLFYFLFIAFLSSILHHR